MAQNIEPRIDGVQPNRQNEHTTERMCKCLTISQLVISILIGIVTSVFGNLITKWLFP